MRERKQALAGKAIPALLAVVLAIASAGRAAANQTITYTYDALGRLTRAVYDDTLTVTFEYDPSGNIVHLAVARAPSGVPEPGASPDLPAVFALAESEPNPFGGSTLVRYAMPRPAEMTLAVYDAAGRLVRMLGEGQQPAGYHAAAWDGRGDGGRRVSNGVYFIRFSAGDFVEARKIVVAR